VRGFFVSADYLSWSKIASYFAAMGVPWAHSGLLALKIQRLLLLYSGGLEEDSQPMRKPRQKGIVHPVICGDLCHSLYW
jgi:hypothetical protein